MAFVVRLTVNYGYVLPVSTDERIHNFDEYQTLVEQLQAITCPDCKQTLERRGTRDTHRQRRGHEQESWFCLCPEAKFYLEEQIKRQWEELKILL